MGNKIIIDEKDFNEKVIGWIERRAYVTSNDLTALLKGLSTTTSIDESIEERAKKYSKADGFKFLAYVKGATEQNIISKIKSKECKHEDWYYSRLYNSRMCPDCNKIEQL